MTFAAGSSISGDDDKEETILKRLEVYKTQTSALIDYYKKQGILSVVDGNLDREETFSEMLKAIKALNISGS